MNMTRFLLLLLLMTSACFRQQPAEKTVETPETSMETPEPQGLVLAPVSADAFPVFKDDEDRSNFLLALDRQLVWLGKQPKGKSWNLAGQTVTRSRMVSTLKRFRELWVLYADKPEQLSRFIAAEFSVFRFEWNGSPDVLITGYHAPVFEGSLKPSEKYRYPLYARPSDLVVIKPSLFPEKFLKPGDSLRGNKVMARLDGKKVVPFYTREQIDKQGALAGRGLELVYLSDYFDAFTFQVQGGGFVKLDSGGYLKMAYAGKNGRPYTSIGRLLVDEGIIPEDRISMQAIGTYFGEHPEEVERVCFVNESYVFYTSDGKVIPELGLEHYPPGVLGFPVTPRRSIATDKRYFPGGMLAFVQGNQRQLDGQPASFSAFVLDQDTGGAIRQNHIDYFQGAGDDARTKAGLLLDEQGRVFFLLLKEKAAS